LGASAVVISGLLIAFVLRAISEVRRTNRFLTTLRMASPGFTTESQFRQELGGVGELVPNGAHWDNGEVGDGIRFESSTPFMSKNMFLGAAIFRKGTLVSKSVMFGSETCCRVVVVQSLDHDNPELQDSPKIYEQRNSDKFLTLDLGNKVVPSDVDKAFSFQLNCLYFWYRCNTASELMPSASQLAGTH